MTCCYDNAIVEGGGRNDGLECLLNRTSNRRTDHKHSLLVVCRSALKNGKFPKMSIFSDLDNTIGRYVVYFWCISFWIMTSNLNFSPEESSAFEQVNSSAPVETLRCFGINENHGFSHLNDFYVDPISMKQNIISIVEIKDKLERNTRSNHDLDIGLA